MFIKLRQPGTVREAAALRFLRPEDAVALAGLEWEIFPDAWSAEHFASLLGQGHFQAAGAFGRTDSRSASALWAYVSGYNVAGELEIVNMAVRVELRGQGLGARVLRFFLDGVAAGGLGRAVLEVRRGNVAARALYTRCGFTVIGVRRKYYSDTGEDALLMEWRTSR